MAAGAFERYELRRAGGFRLVVRDHKAGFCMTDHYPIALDVTRLPAGRYWLVHRANPDFHLRELRYGDDAAALLIRVDWPGGRGAPPRISTLRTCSRERC